MTKCLTVRLASSKTSNRKAQSEVSTVRCKHVSRLAHSYVKAPPVSWQGSSFLNALRNCCPGSSLSQWCDVFLVANSASHASSVHIAFSSCGHEWQCQPSFVQPARMHTVIRGARSTTDAASRQCCDTIDSELRSFESSAVVVFALILYCL